MRSTPIISGRIVSQPSGPGGSASDPAATPALSAAEVVRYCATERGARLSGRVGGRGTRDVVEQRTRECSGG